MKRLIILSAPAIILLFVLSGCHIGGVRGSGVRKTETRELAPFTSIETTGAYYVDVTCQKANSFEIEGDDNILPLITTEVRNGVLHISSTKGFSVRQSINLRIGTADLVAVKSTGVGNFKITDLRNDKFDIDTTGAGKITVSGLTKSLNISSTGAGRVDAHGLRAERADVNVTGAGEVDLAVSDELDVTVSGAGRVVYSGNPKVNKHVSGAGQVTKREETGV